MLLYSLIFLAVFPELFGPWTINQSTKNMYLQIYCLVFLPCLYENKQLPAYQLYAMQSKIQIAKQFVFIMCNYPIQFRFRKLEES